jgi:Cd2+/Zn2+-exporting ATPase
MAELRVHVHEMDCADEAALVRRALASIEAIEEVEFDLIHGFVDVTFDDRSTNEAALIRAVRSTGLHAHAVSLEDGHRVVAEEHAGRDHAQLHGSTIATSIGGALLLAGWIIEGLRADHWLDTFVHGEQGTHDERAVIVYALAVLAGLWPLLPRAWAAIRYRRLDMHALVCLTVIGAAAIGEWSEGAAVAFLFGLAHRMEAWSIERARAEIAALVDRVPSLVAEGQQPVPTRRADRTPTSGSDEGSASRGGDIVRWKGPGGPAGPTERWIERFAAVYTPAVSGTAVIVAVVPALVDGEWSTWFYRALLFLVLACPCALVISTPVTIIAALSAAARHGVLVRGGAILERAAYVTAPTRQGLAEAGITLFGAHGVDIHHADVVLTEPDERSITLLVRHARRAMRVVRQNVAISLLTKAAFLASAPFGFAPLWMAVLADTGATVVVTVNGLRLLRTGHSGQDIEPVGRSEITEKTASP